MIQTWSNLPKQPLVSRVIIVEWSTLGVGQIRIRASSRSDLATRSSNQNSKTCPTERETHWIRICTLPDNEIAAEKIRHEHARFRRPFRKRGWNISRKGSAENPCKCEATASNCCLIASSFREVALQRISIAFVGQFRA